MYLEFLEKVSAILRLLNEAESGGDVGADVVPYVDQVPVILSGELCGFIVDEVGGVYSYAPATNADTVWWEARPRAQHRAGT